MPGICSWFYLIYLAVARPDDDDLPDEVPPWICPVGVWRPLVTPL